MRANNVAGTPHEVIKRIKHYEALGYDEYALWVDCGTPTRKSGSRLSCSSTRSCRTSSRRHGVTRGQVAGASQASACSLSHRLHAQPNYGCANFGRDPYHSVSLLGRDHARIANSITRPLTCSKLSTCPGRIISKQTESTIIRARPRCPTTLRRHACHLHEGKMAQPAGRTAPISYSHPAPALCCAWQ